MKIYIKRSLSIVSICFLFVIGNIFAGDMLTPVSYSYYFNHDLEEISEADCDIDLLFIGASRVYRTFVPQIFEDNLGLECVVNAGSSSQPINATYYQLLDLIERYDINEVILGVTFDQLLGEDYSTQAELIVYDRLSLKNKIYFAIDVLSGMDKLYASYVYRFSENLNNVWEIYQQKESIIENDYVDYSETGEYYADTGFVYSNISYDTGTIPITGSGTFSEKDINNEKLDYLKKCVELCKENGIEISLVTAPTSMMRIYSIENYQGAVDYYASFAEQYEISYYNLNYLIGREDFLPDEYMHDYNHVNGKGAYVISEIFSEVLLKENSGNDVQNLFYDNIDDLKQDVDRIVAVGADISVDSDSNQAKISIKSLQNENVEPTYKVEIKENGQDDYSTLVDWTKESEIEVNIPYESEYVIKVIAKSDNSSEDVAYQIYQY